jgi:3-hydroxyacyl-[acyl-carrier-protein] dehydratase
VNGPDHGVGARPGSPTLMCPLEHIGAEPDGENTIVSARKTVRREEAFIGLALSAHERADIFPGSFYFEAVRQSLLWLRGPQAPGALDLLELRSARYQAMATVGDELRMRAVVGPWRNRDTVEVESVFRRADGQLLVRMKLLFGAGREDADDLIDPARFHQWIPYRDPMMLVDRVVLHERGRLIHTLKAISRSDPVFHRLPGERGLDTYAYPAGLVVNSWGQSAVLLARACVESAGTIATASARRFSVHRKVYPGDVLRHVVRLDQVMYDSTFFVSGETFVGDDLVARGSLVMTVQDPKAYAAKMADILPLETS